MNKNARAVTIASLLCGLLAVVESLAQNPALLDADRAFAAAMASRDATRVGAFLHADLRWTDAAGVTLDDDQVSETLPQPLIGAQSTAQVTYHDYAQIGVAQVDQGKLHAVRVWVQQPSGWKLLVYQEVRSLDQPPVVTPGAGEDCENPCRTVGMQPENAVQAAVIAAYKELEVAAETRDIPLWSSRIAEEFVAASSNSDRLFDKPSRIEGLRQSAMRGLSPTPLVSGRMYDFPGAVVMISEHIPDRGKPLHVTRVWVNRDGRWVETLSYQTAVQSAEAR
jgi:hypothetical protein